MANCQEPMCVNVQSAICLHCSYRLCATHIVAHGTDLLKEGDILCEQINELVEHLNNSLKKVHIARETAMNELNIWRQNQIDKVDDKYAEKIQVIEFRKDHLTDRENEFIRRLEKEAIQPLQRMHEQQSASSQALQTIRQTIENIARDSTQLDLASKESSPSSSITNTATTNKNPPQQYSQLNPSGLPPLMNNPFSTNQTTNSNVWYYPVANVAPTASANSFQAQATTVFSSPSPTKSNLTAAAVALLTVSRPQTASSKAIVKRPPINSCGKLVAFFQDVSGSSDSGIETYIIKYLHGVVHVNNMMILLLSFLEAWCSMKPTAVFNERVLSYHIPIIKKYINGREHELTVIAAIQVFINSCKYNDTKSGEMMILLLRCFFDNKCITKETVLDWYKNGASYGYAGFEKAKLSANLFIDYLNTNVE